MVLGGWGSMGSWRLWIIRILLGPVCSGGWEWILEETQRWPWRAKEKKNKSKDPKAKEDEEETDPPKAKRSRQERRQQDTTPSGASANTQKKRKGGADVHEATDKPSRRSKQAATTLKPNPKHVEEVQKYVNKFKDINSEKPDDKLKLKMKGKLRIPDMNECRLNVYWKNPACGCHSYSTSSDISHFYFHKIEVTNGSYMTRLAMALKCAEMFVSWWNRCLGECCCTISSVWTHQHI